MKYFETYRSNTYAGSGNQYIFSAEEKRVGRIFYKIANGGSFSYSFLFSNTVDSTFSNGAVSHKNLICDEWQILGVRVGRCAEIERRTFQMTDEKEYPEIVMGEDASEADIAVGDFKEVTFCGEKQKLVHPGEMFASDPVCLTLNAGEYLCLEIAFQGSMIPSHEESIIPCFVKTGEKWTFSKKMPYASMVGCDRKVDVRVGYIGDSITQGIGTAINSYAHWNARVSEKLGERYAFWNLGLGYGRAEDAASDGAWLFKAKQNDVVVVCFGVNDLHQGNSEEQIKKYLLSIVTYLKKAGVKVLVQTIPPFDYQGAHIQMWKNINEYIRNDLAGVADAVFDVVPVLGKGGEESHRARYGGHPNAEGCEAWAEALYPVLKELIER
ncbi:MAG: SGNH/GDSL hydrolase family protein [Lachnospiraceae bacterium]|nr:SGNH/GDSL hydrolase family protein [Lachnospiraceae bacterium]